VTCAGGTPGPVRNNEREMNNDMDLTALWPTLPRRYPELRGQVAVVTGSSQGIGKGIAVRLAAEGMKVVITGLGAERVEAVAAELRALGAEALGIPGNHAEEGAIDQLFSETRAAVGPVQVLVNNAADKRRRPFLDGGMALLDSQWSVNFRAPYLCALRAAEGMRDAKLQGSIINISSVGGLRAHWPGLPYDALKGALDSMTRALALDLAEYGIRVNAVAPGAINTGERPQHDLSGEGQPPKPAWFAGIKARGKDWLKRYPAGRVGTPLDIGAAVAFLASPDADYITGEILYVDGGITAQLSPRTSPI
jgi:NAD(P)-dependent dehydrogenase (short-subunit alcohol dehydrogenase family)